MSLRVVQTPESLRSEPQDYVVVPGQPWLDGFSVGEGLIRQFVATAASLGAKAAWQGGKASRQKAAHELRR